MAYSRLMLVDFGAAYAGLATVGYALFNADGTANGSRVTAGVVERGAGTGIYGATVSLTEGWNGEIRWDTGDASPIYASETIADQVALTAAATTAIRTEMEGTGTKLSNTYTVVAGMTGQVTALVNRLGGWAGEGVNTVLGAFRALLRKDATLPSDIGGTFSPATDSVEAVQEKLAAVEEDTGTTLPAAISAIEAGSGGDATAENQVAILAALRAGAVTVESAVTEGLDIEVVQYDDYLTANGRQLSWSNAAGDWAGGDLTTATVTFAIKTKDGTAVLSKSGAIVTATGTQVVTVDLTSANTALLTKPGNQYRYQLLITKSTYRETEVTGNVIVTASLSPPA